MNFLNLFKKNIEINTVLKNKDKNLPVIIDDKEITISNLIAQNSYHKGIAETFQNQLKQQQNEYKTLQNEFMILNQELFKLKPKKIDSKELNSTFQDVLRLIETENINKQDWIKTIMNNKNIPVNSKASASRIRSDLINMNLIKLIDGIYRKI